METAYREREQDPLDTARGGRPPLRRLRHIALDRRTPWAVLLLGLGAVFALRGPLLAARALYPACAFYGITGYWCPGCGNTRSVLCLLQGELVASLRYNILPALCGVLGLLYFIEWVLQTRGKNTRLLPRSEPFWFMVLGLWLAYCLVRNFIPGIAP